MYYGVAPDPSLVTYNLFDSKNRLVGTWTFNAGTQTDGAVYTLDSLDRVLSESEWHSGVSSRTDFTYIGLSDAVGQEQHYDGSGALTETKSYVYDALGRPATLTDTPAGGATGRFSYVFDPHGSVELVIDQSRHVEAAYGYNAYGDSNLSLTKTAAGFSPNTNAFQFQSERYDTGSKTIDFGARHYNPALERFTQRDSYQAALDNLGLSTDPLNGNRYALTGANPINFVDLDGHQASFGWFGMTAGKKSPGAKWTAPGFVDIEGLRETRSGSSSPMSPSRANAVFLTTLVAMVVSLTAGVAVLARPVTDWVILVLALSGFGAALAVAATAVLRHRPSRRFRGRAPGTWLIFLGIGLVPIVEIGPRIAKLGAVSVGDAIMITILILVTLRLRFAGFRCVSSEIERPLSGSGHPGGGHFPRCPGGSSGTPDSNPRPHR